MNSIVVARYKEDISWLNQIDIQNNRITVYEKHDVPNDEGIPIATSNGDILHGINRFMLPNVGNEAHTYVHHIVKHYNHYKLYRGNGDSRVFFLQGHPFDHSPETIKYTNGNKQIVGEYMTLCSVQVTSDAKGYPHHPELPVGQYYEKIFDKPFNEILTFGAGAQFAVTKRAIASKPLSFWMKLLRLSENTTTAPFVFERLWHKFFEVS